MATSRIPGGLMGLIAGLTALVVLALSQWIEAAP
jgi:hypothetical protein